MAETMSALPAETMSALPAGTMSALPAETMSALPAETMSALPAETMSALPAETMSALPAETMSALPAEYRFGLWRHLVSSARDRFLLTFDVGADETTVSPAATYTCSYCRLPGHENKLATGDEDGTISVWNTSLAEQAVVRYRGSHANAVYELDFDATGRQLLSCAGDRTIKRWDMETMQLLSLHQRKARTFKTVSFLPDSSNVFASGGRDGVVEVWDARVSGGVSHEIHPQSAKKGRATPDTTALSSVTSLLFRDENYLLSAGSTNASVNVWDLRKTYVGGGAKRAHTPFERFDWLPSDRGVVSMAIDRINSRLYVSRINDVIQRYSLVAWQPERGMLYGGHEARSYFVRCSVSPDGNWLLSGSSDWSARVWHTGVSGNPVCSLPGHVQEVTCTAWSPNSTELATISDDNTLRTWRIGGCDGSRRLADLHSSDPQCLYPTACGEVDNSNNIRVNTANNLRWLTARQLHWCRMRNRLATCQSPTPGAGAGRPPSPTRAPPCSSQSPVGGARVAGGSPGFMRSWLRRVSPAVGKLRRPSARTSLADSVCSEGASIPAVSDTAGSERGDRLVSKRERPSSPIVGAASDGCSDSVENRENVGRSPRKRARVDCVTPLRPHQPTSPIQSSPHESATDAARPRRSSPRKLFSSRQTQPSMVSNSRSSAGVRSLHESLSPPLVSNGCVSSDGGAGGGSSTATGSSLQSSAVLRRSSRKLVPSPAKQSDGSPLRRSCRSPGYAASPRDAAGVTSSSTVGDVTLSAASCEFPVTGRSSSLASAGESPTARLPNWVVDGVSPHSPLARASRQCRRSRRSADWLTLLSRQRQTQSPRH